MPLPIPYGFKLPAGINDVQLSDDSVTVMRAGGPAEQLQSLRGRQGRALGQQPDCCITASARARHSVAAAQSCLHPPGVAP
jgi:hypothetical protein